MSVALFALPDLAESSAYRDARDSLGVALMNLCPLPRDLARIAAGYGVTGSFALPPTGSLRGASAAMRRVSARRALSACDNLCYLSDEVLCMGMAMFCVRLLEGGCLSLVPMDHLPARLQVPLAIRDDASDWWPSEAFDICCDGRVLIGIPRRRYSGSVLISFWDSTSGRPYVGPSPSSLLVPVAIFPGDKSPPIAEFCWSSVLGLEEGTSWVCVRLQTNRVAVAASHAATAAPCFCDLLTGSVSRGEVLGGLVCRSGFNGVDFRWVGSTSCTAVAALSSRDLVVWDCVTGRGVVRNIAIDADERVSVFSDVRTGVIYTVDFRDPVVVGAHVV